MTYRAMMVEKLDTPLVETTLEPTTPDRDQVSIDVEACALNFADLLLVKGTYQEKFDLPFAPGMEVCGRVTGIGPDVDGLAVGQRVVSYCGHGGLAEQITLPAGSCIPVPDTIDPVKAAAVPIAYGTSHLALGHRARLAPGERLAVLGATGGVGSTAVELGRLMGAEVVACVRGPQKVAAAEALNPHHVIDYGETDLRKALTDLGGIDVVYDPVGGDLLKEVMRACNPEARILPLGFASGQVPEIKANHLLVKNLSVLGFYWGAYTTFAPHILNNSLRQILDWLDQGVITPNVGHILPLAAANDGLALLSSRTAIGKVVIDMRLP